MTSRNSFWDSMKENHKRRIWVWIAAGLTQLIIYIGVLMVYLSRINTWNAEGAYQTAEAYKDALYGAAQDALGFQDNLVVTVAFLAIIIGMQGFSYLYDKRKVDLYHSVPVSKDRRFLTIYVNGILIYVIPTLIALAIGTLLAAAQGAVQGTVILMIVLAFLWNLLYFLVLYHMMILAVMLTGNWFVTLCVFGILALYEAGVYELMEMFQYNFFATKDNYFVHQSPKFSILYDYSRPDSAVANLSEPSAVIGAVLSYFGKWFLIAAVLLAVAYFCYRKRASEAAGRAIAFKGVQPVLKVAVVIPVAMTVGGIVWDASYESVFLMAVGMLASGVIVCAVMEIIYDFDIRSLIKHLASSGVAVAGVLAVFVIFKYDLFGYDKYIPRKDEVESIAFCNDYNYYYYWGKDFRYVAPFDYMKEHMFITDTEPMLALAEKAQQTEVEDMTEPAYLHVMYRLKSGREVGRGFYVDLADSANGGLLDRLIGTQEYRVGMSQTFTDEEAFSHTLGITYTNGTTKTTLPAEDAMKLREAWIKDMEQCDFSMYRENFPCGRIRFTFPNYIENDLPVYDCFENTIAVLAQREAYYPITVDAEAIESITVTNHHYDLVEKSRAEGGYIDDGPLVTYEARQTAAWERDNITVTETFYDTEQISQIVKGIYPVYGMNFQWRSGEQDFDANYEVSIVFKGKTTYPYARGEYYFEYRFFTGQVPDFVEEATAVSEEPGNAISEE